MSFRAWIKWIVRCQLLSGILMWDIPCPLSAKELDPAQWSPDHTMCAFLAPGQHLDQGEECSRLSVFTSSKVPVFVAHVWTIEPNGIQRLKGRGCEAWGWIDNNRLFCEASVNPFLGFYRIFDAKTGSEMAEYVGGHFVMSPDVSERVLQFLLNSSGD